MNLSLCPPSDGGRARGQHVEQRRGAAAWAAAEQLRRLRRLRGCAPRVLQIVHVSYTGTLSEGSQTCWSKRSVTLHMSTHGRSEPGSLQAQPRCWTQRAGHAQGDRDRFRDGSRASGRCPHCASRAASAAEQATAVVQRRRAGGRCGKRIPADRRRPPTATTCSSMAPSERTAKTAPIRWRASSTSACHWTKAE